MLNVSKSITVTGQSVINGSQVVAMSATISTDGNNNANIVKTIINQDLYNKNKVEVRADMDSFEEEVYRIEDEVATTPEGGEENEVK